jgi:hypothetical protein
VLHLTSFALAVIILCSLLTLIAIPMRQPWVIGACGLLDLAVVTRMIHSARRCTATTAKLLWRAGRAAGLEAVQSVEVPKNNQGPPPQKEHHANYLRPAAVGFNLTSALSRDIHEKL